MMRARNKIKPEISAQQCGFVEGKGKTNAMYMLRTITERALEMQNDVYLCFIDMYWQQTAAVRVDNEIGDFQKIKKGVRQGCMLSPDLFSLYSEHIMRHIEGLSGIMIGGHMINNLRYADDTVIMATIEQDLQTLLNIIVENSEKVGLTLNKKKTTYEAKV